MDKNDPEAQCRRCTQDKPCARCGKKRYAIGRITRYGPVCTPCSVYFREAESCESCGRVSRRLSRIKRLGGERRLCPQCARTDHGTCQACKRSRLLETAPDGRELCRICTEEGEKICPSCGELMPAGYGKTCEACYWRKLLQKRIEIDCAAFEGVAMANHFRSFGGWLGTELGVRKAAMVLHRHLPFFLALETAWGRIPDYRLLLGYFGALGLRRSRLPMRWMSEFGLVVVDKAAREANSERRRIQSTLARLDTHGEAWTILNGYYQQLGVSAEAGQTQLKSVRLALTPAAALLSLGLEMERTPPDQAALDAYLEKTPGQRAAVSGFVGYLRDQFEVDIHLPRASGRAARKRHKRLEQELLGLMAKPGTGEAYVRRLLTVALAYFHGVTKKVAGEVALSGVMNMGDGEPRVVIEGREYAIPIKVMECCLQARV